MKSLTNILQEALVKKHIPTDWNNGKFNIKLLIDNAKNEDHTQINLKYGKIMHIYHGMDLKDTIIKKYLDAIQLLFDKYDMSKSKFTEIIFHKTSNSSPCVLFADNNETYGSFIHYKHDNAICYIGTDGFDTPIDDTDKIYKELCR